MGPLILMSFSFKGPIYISAAHFAYNFQTKTDGLCEIFGSHRLNSAGVPFACNQLKLNLIHRISILQ